MSIHIIRKMSAVFLSILLLPILAQAEKPAKVGSQLAYLDDRGPYYPNLGFPKLTTPMWIGEKDVDAAILLSIDDMRDPAAYEKYLRPLLDRLKQIDGRAPVSIFTCRVVPSSPRLQQFVQEGLSVEIHTVSHPCPLFRAPANLPAGADSLTLVRDDYVPCIANMNQIPGNQPVAFRMPCCDSLNTNTPRFYSEIFPQRTKEGRFLTISSSVFVLLTPEDPELDRNVVFDPEGTERFRKYIPFRNYAGIIENYPYPYVVDRLVWELPCVAPSDWSAQHLHRPDNPKTIEDWLVALDGVVAKQGLFTLVFHPHNWIKSTQLAEMVDHASRKHGSKIRFLNCREINDRFTKNLLGGHPLRAQSGADNGVRLVDVNADGYLDVIVANSKTQIARIWNEATQSWQETPFPVRLVTGEETEAVQMTEARFFVVPTTGHAGFLVVQDSKISLWEFAKDRWTLSPLEIPAEIAGLGDTSDDQGLRFRDVNGDGADDLLIANGKKNVVLLWDAKLYRWLRAPFSLPPDCQIVDASGRDNGLRFIDLDSDGDEDLVCSNDRGYAVYRFADREKGWRTPIRSGVAGSKDSIPAIVLNGRPSGAWFHGRALYMANEFTPEKPDLTEKVTFDELLRENSAATNTLPVNPAP